MAKCGSWAWQAERRPSPSAKIARKRSGGYRWLVGQHDVYDFPGEADAHGEATSLPEAKRAVEIAIYDVFGAGHGSGKWTCVPQR